MRVGIAGLGLIGGSLALALRSRHDVRGFDVDPAAREAASGEGIATVDRLEDLIPAEAIIVATPMRSVLPTLAALASHTGGAVILDVASVRGPVDAFARDSADGTRLVGMHPMAGRTGRGFVSADPALLAGRPFLVVPTARSTVEAMAVAGTVARDAGGVVTVCSAAEHDRLVALTSALPLALAAALAASAADAGPSLATFAGPGFRDTTRLADTSADLAEALLVANAGNVVAAIARMRTVLDELERVIAERDASGLREILERAARGRALLG
ncbi:MAG TPA: prephenate dehydrogenase/arogenate dehydrogenase family protein [Candidatus Acidoferrales bacterium]|nr:prephenate dehydrogenase/arogenate dehydrogenase family protein [Candidatus Acidoferrales bacterium]